MSKILVVVECCHEYVGAIIQIFEHVDDLQFLGIDLRLSGKAISGIGIRFF